jgi:hypothetical protein
MDYQIKVKTPEEFLSAFPIKMEEVDRVIGQPNFTKISKVTVALKKNCIAMYDSRSRVGKLHCIINSQTQEDDGVGIPASVHPGTPTLLGLEDAFDRDNYMLNHKTELAEWQEDFNIKEACKRFLISRLEPAYLQQMADPVTGFKGVSIRDMIVFLERKYPAEPEEIELQEALMRTQWDSNNHIENLFQDVKEGCETLRRMNAITEGDIPRVFIKYVYKAIRNTGHFERACIRWKALPTNERSTIAQIRDFFAKKYDIFETEQDSLHLVGVANSVQTEVNQATSNAFVELRDQQEERDSDQQAQQQKQDTFNANMFQMMKENKASVADDNATAYSALTTQTSMQDKRRIDDLEAQLRSLSTGHTGSSTGGSSRGGASRGGSGRGGSSQSGGRGGRGGGNRGSNYICRSDGPPNTRKTTKWFGSSDTYCWTHGYDCSNRHESSTCNHKKPGHREAATGTNTLGGSIKDKEFSKFN